MVLSASDMWHLLMRLCQALAARIDDWDTHGLFDADGSKSVMWLILGLGISPGHVTNSQTVCRKASGQSFHRMARVFWVHMVFDMLASQCGLECDTPKVCLPNILHVEALEKDKEGVKPVSVKISVPAIVSDVALTVSQLLLWLTNWSTNLNKLFAEPPKCSASVRTQRITEPRSNSLHEGTQVGIGGPDAADSCTEVATPERGTISISNSRLIGEAGAQSSTAVLLRRMPVDVSASAAIAMAQLEGMQQRDKNMRHSHVVNNLSMAGAVLSMLVNVSHARLL